MATNEVCPWTADRSLAREFDKLCAKIFRRQGFKVQEQARFVIKGRLLVIDMIVNGPNNDDRLVEIKWSANPKISLKEIRDWGARFGNIAWRVPDETRVLILSGTLAPSRRLWAEQEFDLTIWDRLVVLKEAKIAGLEQEAVAFFQESDSQFINGGSSPKGAIEDEAPPSNISQTLLERLKEVPPGKQGAKAYEQVCQDVIEFLFSPYLLDPRPQARTDNDLNVMDWSTQSSVDTPLGALPIGFELLRTDASEVSVAPYGIIE